MLIRAVNVLVNVLSISMLRILSTVALYTLLPFIDLLSDDTEVMQLFQYDLCFIVISHTLNPPLGYLIYWVTNYKMLHRANKVMVIYCLYHIIWIG